MCDSPTSWDICVYSMMSHPHGHHAKNRPSHKASNKERVLRYGYIVAALAVVLGIIFILSRPHDTSVPRSEAKGADSGLQDTLKPFLPEERWLQRAYLIDRVYHQVYTPGWEGAYGALGDAYLFAATHDSSLWRFHFVAHPLIRLSNGYWLDDRAWACLAELTWWELTGKKEMQLVTDAVYRYNQAREAGMLSNHEGYWAWYKHPPGARTNDPVFTNTNMNQMANVACRLFDATHEKHFLDDALLVWNGDEKSPGIEKQLYQGAGRWHGREGLAAFGKELPWNGTGYCSIGAALYRSTGDPRYKAIVVETARRILDPSSGWVDPVDFYQLNMDGNGAFVHFLMDAYSIAPSELSDLPEKIEKMLEHVWSNAHGRARVVLHREFDHGIRNGWNPEGGEDGYGVDEVGTVHAQAEAVRAFGLFAYFHNATLPPASGSQTR
jgi:hypothetical protein